MEIREETGMGIQQNAPRSALMLLYPNKSKTTMLPHSESSSSSSAIARASWPSSRWDRPIDSLISRPIYIPRDTGSRWMGRLVAALGNNLCSGTEQPTLERWHSTVTVHLQLHRVSSAHGTPSWTACGLPASRFSRLSSCLQKRVVSIASVDSPRLPRRTLHTLVLVSSQPPGIP